MRGVVAPERGPDDDRPAEADFAAFVVAQSNSLHRTAYLLTGDRDRAQDAVQTALLRIYQAWSRRGSWENPEGYAHQVVTRVVLSSARRRWWGELPTAELPEPNGARFRHVDTGRRRAGCVASGLADVAGEAALRGGVALLPGHARGRGRRGDAMSSREREKPDLTGVASVAVPTWRIQRSE